MDINERLMNDAMNRAAAARGQSATKPAPVACAWRCACCDRPVGGGLFGTDEQNAAFLAGQGLPRTADGQWFCSGDHLRQYNIAVERHGLPKAVALAAPPPKTPAKPAIIDRTVVARCAGCAAFCELNQRSVDRGATWCPPLEKTLDALGWIIAAGRQFCGKGCSEKPVQAPKVPIAPVVRIQDVSYDKARAAARARAGHAPVLEDRELAAASASPRVVKAKR